MMLRWRVRFNFHTSGCVVYWRHALVEYVKSTFTTTWRKSTYVLNNVTANKMIYRLDSCGTCSMLPRDQNGVVDHNLKVYGTNNLRVVDLSVVPLHFGSHTQGTTADLSRRYDLADGLMIHSYSICHCRARYISCHREYEILSCWPFLVCSRWYHQGEIHACVMRIEIDCQTQ